MRISIVSTIIFSKMIGLVQGTQPEAQVECPALPVMAAATTCQSDFGACCLWARLQRSLSLTLLYSLPCSLRATLL